ncbi:hypothetical protein ACFX2C_047007 [Malus domestica]
MCRRHKSPAGGASAATAYYAASGALSSCVTASFRLGVNSATKSANAWAFITMWGWYAKLYWPSFNTHFITR